MVVTFYRTTESGSKERGRVTYENGKLESKDKGLLRLLFANGDDTPEKIEAAMRGAPRRFDGAYLRASFSE